MIIVKATRDSEAGVMPAGSLVGAFTPSQVKSREEALAWSRRFPNPAVDGGVEEMR
jgi:hypothetical protein